MKIRLNNLIACLRERDRDRDREDDGERSRFERFECSWRRFPKSSVQKRSEYTITDDELMVSFDVSSLFPSVPVDIALAKLEAHLKCNIKHEKKSIYMEVASLCMKQSYFQFRDKIYKVEFGTNMGHPLSPLIAELFMAAFEIDLKTNEMLPRIWHRYTVVNRLRY